MFIFFLPMVYLFIFVCTLNILIHVKILLASKEMHSFILCLIVLLIAQICGGVSNRRDCQGCSNHDNLPTSNSSVRPTGKPSTLMLL